MEIFNCEQGTDEWLMCRMGIPTASMFSTVMASGKGGSESKTRRTYMLKLVGERITGELSENYKNEHMQRGNEMEPEARAAYEFMNNVTCVQVGFIKNHGAGASLDSIVNDDGAVEIKTKLPHLQLDVLLSDAVPAEHIPQIQGQMWISEREWVDFVSYWPKLPMFTKRVYRDDAYINTKLWPAIDKFNEELDKMTTRFSV